MPLTHYAAEMFGIVEDDNTQRGEILLKCDFARCWSKGDSRYDVLRRYEFGLSSRRRRGRPAPIREPQWPSKTSTFEP
ncbi:hypothetical protein bAD24_p01525 (plasmid) [Burkholderia sp. AD24]|nr:hypothetical protein bAD24_p01525 [Burkholderia sp. AD24]